MMAALPSRPPQSHYYGRFPPVLRVFLALFAVSSLVGVLFLYEASHALLSSFVSSSSSSSPSSSRNKGRPSDFDLDGRDPLRGDDGLVVTTWADTDDGRGCRNLLPPPIKGRRTMLSPSALWTLLGPRVLNASYYPPLEHGTSAEFRRYVNTIFSFYTSARLRRSASHPAPAASVRRIIALVDNYKRQRQRYYDSHHHRKQLRHSFPSNASSGAQGGPDSVSPPKPIRILVIGGSVTKGVGSLASSEVRLERTRPDPYYAWPARLEHMLNEVYFPGGDKSAPKGFKVDNYAVGATNSEVGAAMLEYQLLPGLDQNPPDIIIAAYAANDARDPDRNATLYKHQQNLVVAAHNTRPCDDDLPLVILADDMHGYLDEVAALEVTGGLYKLASWYNVMAVTYGNVARHASLAHYANVTHPNPLLGSGYDSMHHGVGMHVGIAWTMFFNLMAAFQNTCSDIIEAVATDNSRTHAALDTMDSMKGSLVEPPTKYQGRISPIDVASQEWKHRIEEKDRDCPMPSRASADGPPYATAACSYAWAVNPVTITEPHHVDEALKPVLVRANGWRADYFAMNGKAFTTPGFGTDTNRSRFSLALRNVTQETQFLTIFSMSSHGKGFAHSVLRLTVRIERASGGPASKSKSKEDDSAPTTNESSESNESNEATYDLKGGHELRTSVFFPHKFRLPGHGARVGDTVRLDGELVAGTAFKIQAVAFCRS